MHFAAFAVVIEAVPWDRIAHIVAQEIRTRAGILIAVDLEIPFHCGS